MKSIFVFRRSFRLYDNTGLIECCKNSEKVYPIFIFTKKQLLDNKYKSNSAVQFMIESLKDLNEQLSNKNSKLFLLYGEIIENLKKFINDKNINSIYLNKDYTPYSIIRDQKIEDLCKEMKIKFFSYDDILLQNMGDVLTNAQTPYKIYSQFRKKTQSFTVTKPNDFNFNNLALKSEKYSSEISFSKSNQFYNFCSSIFLKGGRKEALKILKNVSKYDTYSENRNLLTYKTTNLSPYIKFGCISIRELFYTIKTNLKNNTTLIDQLYWRDFYYNIIFFFPEVIGNSMHNKNIKWQNDITQFEKWSEGKTGFPIVDACMRQLNQTGYMPNRGRLIVSSFLTKLLLTDWKKGEWYFATKLIDYDVAVNNGNWQWVAGTGVDRQQYNRIFNPWLQSSKFDPEAKYIKTWVPELKNIQPNIIHQWYNYYDKLQNKYYKPMIDYKKQRKIALEKFAKI